MGLLSIIRKLKAKDHELRILVLGLDNAGKTTIMKRLTDQPTSTISPTLGFNITTFSLPPYVLNFWDIGGQRTIRAYWRNYFEQTDALVWVVDSADRTRLGDCAEELHALLKEDRLMGASLLVFANKQDIAGALSVEEISRVLRLDILATHRWSIRPCCAAVAADNLLDGIRWLVNDVSAHVLH
ncbi:hypothetical protein LPJ66_005563 [Kickxella alabastrina]|uniref:Uncharacterized protein n=1 Tax=Kickxella alabastrina TaxID=61397 RepID=A0ACC1IE72_9FUNG|nr:hypothetical protein LPJ66_005563 [Kickxella alabastrina]